MPYNPKYLRKPNEAIGNPEDDKATDAIGRWSTIALLKGIWDKLATGIQIPAGIATEAKQDILNTRAGDLTEGAPATDTASSGLNGRLQRIAQRLTALIAQVPATLGQKAKGASLAVTLASDEDLLGRLGEVQASPTANTVLDRLKALLTGIVLAAGTNVVGFVNLITGQTGVDGGSGTVSAKTLRTALATDVPLPAGTNMIGQVVGYHVTRTTTITRPADVNAYAANDAMSNSTAAPTSGGFTITDAARQSGGSGIITDAVLMVSTAAATSLQGEIWVFDSAVTAINDNDAFALSDTHAAQLVGIIPFTTNKGAGNNSSAHVSGLNIGFTAVGTANLRFLVKVLNAYTPASAEILTARFKIIQTT